MEIETVTVEETDSDAVVSGGSVFSEPGESDVQTEDTLVNEMSDEYANYLDFETPKEKVNFEESIEDMLTRLDEYCGLVDMIRSDTSLCLNKNMMDLQQKSMRMQRIFERIDKLEEFVGHVRQNVATMEDLVNKAEDEMGTFSNIKKMITNISLPTFIKKPTQSKPRSDSRPKFIQPEIFCTDDYFGSKDRVVNEPNEERIHIAAEVFEGEA
ncbi:biogenesis of lysosome-related organelles complex 1 subunit 4-like isoform X1 [Tubulanus polymorphus]|uniref:biogenesis of lysosome-related organelles complex 1 subunit 4-like isoform X1 n=1 Tax=Tubulanus polymorphus TaxID=672921 RepID=UPI003DA4DA66